jgi:hypothetical protein
MVEGEAMSRSSDSTRAGRAALVLACAAGALAVTGCTSAVDPDTRPAAVPTFLPSASTPEASSAVATTGAPLSGVGPTGFPGHAFEIPPDAQSMTLILECAGGGDFSVELGDSMMMGQSPLSGHCTGATELAWPLTAATEPSLSVTVPDGVAWSATPSFSTAPFASDAALGSDCAAFSAVNSAFLNADSGYLHYDAFGAEEWTARVTGATADLEALAADAASPLRDAFAGIHDIVTTAPIAPGTVLEVLAAAAPQAEEITAACNANHTPWIFTSEFGG